MKVLINTKPLSSGHAVRGVGMYTRFLTEELEKQKNIEVFRSGMLKKKSQKFDIIHYPFFDLFSPTLPLIRKKKTVVTIHDVIPLIFPDHYEPGKKGSLAFVRQKFALKKVGAIITDSEASRVDIIKYLDVPPEKIHVVYLAANPFLKRVGETEINKTRRELSLPQNYMLYVGDINYNKNVPQLIKAMRYLPWNVKLVLVGKNFIEQDIPEWQEIESQLALSDVSNRIKFLPSILSDDYENLSAIYSGASAYIQPSLYEGFGLPILEAMRCGVPVISNKNSSLIEVGGNKVIYTGDSAMEIANSMEEVMELSETERQEMIAAAAKWESKFTWQKTAKKTIEVYKKV